MWPKRKTSYPELEVPVGGDHVRVFGGVGSAAVVARLVLHSVDLQDDTLPERQQHKEVHAGTQQGFEGEGVPVPR